MEAAPKLPMLQYELKSSPDNLDFIHKLKALIQGHYNEDPDSFAKELEELAKLRSYACIRPVSDYSGISLLKRYYAQLHLLQNRFKVRKGSEGPFQFSWYDQYSGSIYSVNDIEFEMACVLYNIGALHSFLGSAETRQTSESMKVACTHFQCAAWAFHTLPDRYPDLPSPDLSSELLALLAQTCLAQAQECILEKSILDHRKSSIIAKVGTQVSLYYYAALHKLETSNLRYLSGDVLLGMSPPPGGEGGEAFSIVDIVGLKVNKQWTKHLEFKMVYYKAVAYLYAGLQSEEGQKWGERVTYYQAAADKLAEASKYAGSSSSSSGAMSLKECLVFSNDVIQGKLDNAKKENEFIYHEKVPELDTLPELKGASLVKGVGFEVTDPEVAGADILARLVPLEAHQASSLYSEEKAKLLRGLGDEVEAKDTELAVFMSSMSLDGQVPKPQDHIQLPQELIQVAAKLSVTDDNKVSGKLAEAMERIASVSSDVESSLREIREILQEDKEQEEEYLGVMKKARGPTTIVDEIERECAKYQDAHQMASESNTTLHNAMRLHMDNLKLLALPLDQLQKEIPSLADLPEECEANITEVRRILAKVEEMKDQRKSLTEKFRQDVLEDDITKKLVIHKDKEMDEIFEIELKKHEQAKKIIQQNLAAQANIFQALTEVNARYVETRKTVEEIVNARNEMVGSLVASFCAHEDLLHKAAKGLEFYDKLDSNVEKLLNRVKGVAKVQQEERDAILAKNAPKIPPTVVGAPAVPSTQLPSFPPPPPTDNDAYDNYTPGAPPLPPGGSFPSDTPTSAAMGPPASATAGPGGGGRPTLKDYMKLMKETNSDASAAYAAMRGGPDVGVPGPAVTAAASAPTSARPAPLGSEDDSKTPAASHHYQQQVVGGGQPHPPPAAPFPPSSTAAGPGYGQAPPPFWQDGRQLPMAPPAPQTTGSYGATTAQSYSGHPGYQPKALNPVTTQGPGSVRHASASLSQAPQVPSPAPQVPSPAPQVPSPAPQVPSPAPQVPSSAPQLPSSAPTINSMQTPSSMPSSASYSPYKQNAYQPQIQRPPQQPVHQTHQVMQPQPQQGQAQVLQQGQYPAQHLQYPYPQQQQQQPYPSAQQTATPQQQQQPYPSAQQTTTPQQQQSYPSAQQTASQQPSVSQGHQQAPRSEPNHIQPGMVQPPLQPQQHVVSQQQPVLGQQQQLGFQGQLYQQPPYQGHQMPQRPSYQGQMVPQHQPPYLGQQQVNVLSQSSGQQASFHQRQPPTFGQPSGAAAAQSVQSGSQFVSSHQHQQGQMPVIQAPVSQTPASFPHVSSAMQLPPTNAIAPTQTVQAHGTTQPSLGVSPQPMPRLMAPQQQGYSNSNVTSQPSSAIPHQLPVQAQQATGQVLAANQLGAAVTVANQQVQPASQLGQSAVTQQGQAMGQMSFPGGSQQIRPMAMGQPGLPAANQQQVPRPPVSQTVYGQQPYPAQQQQAYQPTGSQAVNQMPQQGNLTVNQQAISSASQPTSHIPQQPQQIWSQPQQSWTQQNKPPEPEMKLRPVVPQPGTVAAPQPSGLPQQQQQQQQQHNAAAVGSVQSGAGGMPNTLVPQQVGAAAAAVSGGGLQSAQLPSAAAVPMVPTQAAVAAMTGAKPASEFRERRTSFDDMLGDDLEKDDASVALVPKVMTANEIAEQKEQAKARADIARATNNDPYRSPELQQKLLADYRQLSKDVADEKFLNEKWKRLNGLLQVLDNKLTVSVARCYPMKNRVPDVLPYDSSRVELPTTKDDYINASHIRHLSTHSPCFIVTQWPTANTFNDFWIMVWQEKVETIVALVPNNNQNQQETYWPSKNEPKKISLGKGCSELEVTLQSTKSPTDAAAAASNWTERIFTVMNKATNTSRVVIHLNANEIKHQQQHQHPAVSHQAELFSDMARACLSYYRQQRVLTHPVLVHCTDGSGKSAAFSLMTAAMSEVDLANGDQDALVPDLVKMGALICQQRKGVLRERVHLKQAFDGVLNHAKHILVAKEVLKPDHPPQQSDRQSCTAPLDNLDNIQVNLSTAAAAAAAVPSQAAAVASEGQQLLADVQKTSSIFQSAEMLSNLNLSDPLGLNSGANLRNNSPSKKKITKQDFLNAASSVEDLQKKNEASDDPLSQLDPLWSLKANKPS